MPVDNDVSGYFAGQQRPFASAGQAPAVMGLGEVEDGAFGHYARRVDALVAAVVVPLYVVHSDRLGDARLPVQAPQVASKVRVSHDAPEVTLEVGVVDGVEAHERRE